MNFGLTILGVNSAIPANGRVPTSQILQVQSEKFLIDCGEGCQIRMDQFGIGRSHINHIFLSHLHGDHLFGLPGLLYSFSLNQRKAPLHIFAPQPEMLRDILNHLVGIQGRLGYDLVIMDAGVEDALDRLVFENEMLTVHAFQLRHRVPTVGYLFREKSRQPNIRKEKIQEYGLSVDNILRAKSGQDIFLPDGRLIAASELCYPAAPPRSYAYASDTMYSEAIVPIVAGVDLLYHEATFAHELEAYAAETMHSTAKQAAQIALKAKVRKLIIGHFSSRYQDLTPLLKEAQAVFSNTELGEEGKLYKVKLLSSRR